KNAADALSRGVAAYHVAARGHAPAAAANLKTAMPERPDDPFLLRTAGQLVAWYDSQTDRSNLSKDDVAAIEWLRSAGTGRQEFADAYRMAAEARRQNPQSPATAPAADATSTYVTPSTPYTAYAPPPSYYYPAEPYVYPGYSYAYPYYPYTYWPSYSIIVVRDCAFHRRHHHDGWDHRDWGDRGDQLGSVNRGGGIIMTPTDDGGSMRSSSSRVFVGPSPDAGNIRRFSDIPTRTSGARSGRGNDST